MLGTPRHWSVNVDAPGVAGGEGKGAPPIGKGVETVSGAFVAVAGFGGGAVVGNIEAYAGGGASS